MESFEDDGESYADFFLSSYYNGENALIKKEGQEIISALYIIDKTLFLSGKTYSFPFLSAVATRARLRGKRLIENVISDAFAKLLFEKTPYCALYPFSHRYYEKYGFTVINGVDTKKVQALSKEQALNCYLNKNPSASTLLKVYNNYAKDFDGFLVRDLPRFKQLLQDWEKSGNTVRLITCNEKNCYVSYGGGEIEECVGDLSLLGAVEDIVGLEYGRPFGVEPYNMARVVDVCAALSRKGYIEDGKFAFYLKDGFFPQNEGVYILKVNKGKGSGEKISKDNTLGAQEVTIEELTKVLLCGGALGGFEVENVEFFCLDKY